jgi:hypothetical protein
MIKATWEAPKLEVLDILATSHERGSFSDLMVGGIHVS